MAPRRDATLLLAVGAARAAPTEQAVSSYLEVAARLFEAASHARGGDTDAARSHIAEALTLLDCHTTASPGSVDTAGKKARRPPRGGLAPWQERRIAAHIDANLGDQIRIKDLALLLKFSTSHFCRAFRRTFGMSARAWIGRRRIEVAQSMMVSTRAPLIEIALNCGLSDQSHFTRAFRRIVGETPHAWRQSRRGAIEEQITDLAWARANRSHWLPPERGTP